MSDVSGTCLAEMAGIIVRHTPSEGKSRTSVPNLSVVRHEEPTAPRHVSQVPIYALVVQGAKRLTVANEDIGYGAGEFVTVAVDLPVIASVTSASPERPLLGLSLVLDMDAIRRMLGRLPKLGEAARGASPRAFGVMTAPAPLLEATLRYLRLLEAPDDVPALADMMEQEVLYRLLTSAAGPRLIQTALQDGPGTRISQAIAWLRSHYREPLRIEDLAAEVGMSVSSLHHHFKGVTAMTPMQYQKQLRLNEARRLLLAESYDVGSAAFAVGYASRSQFGMEYVRQFGHAPSQDVSVMRREGTSRTRSTAREWSEAELADHV